MAFYSDFAGKTQKIGDIAKYNQRNIEIEKINESLYNQIGKLVYQRYITGLNDPDIVQLMGQIKANSNEINHNNQTIVDLKGLIRCHNCGSYGSNNSQFCSGCGKPMAEDTFSNYGFGKGGVYNCPVCGRQVRPDQAFCEECGTKLSAQPII